MRYRLLFFFVASSNTGSIRSTKDEIGLWNSRQHIACVIFSFWFFKAPSNLSPSILLCFGEIWRPTFVSYSTRDCKVGSDESNRK